MDALLVIFVMLSKKKIKMHRFRKGFFTVLIWLVYWTCL